MASSTAHTEPNTTTAKALLLSSLTTPPSLSLTTIPLPPPTPGTAHIRILSVSLLSYSHSLLTGSLRYPLSLPLVPGGGAIVRLTTLPADATTLQTGQLCLLTPFIRARDEPDNAFLLGTHAGATISAQKLMAGPWRNGTFATHASVPIENLFPLDESVLCQKMGYVFYDLAYLTRLAVPMGAVGSAGLDVKAGERVIVAPASGGFGGAAVEVVLAMGADVVMVGRNDSTLTSIRETILKRSGVLGKIDVVTLANHQDEDIDKIKTCGEIDKYIDFSPASASSSTHITTCLLSLRKNGSACFMGGIPGDVNIPYGVMMFNNLTIKGRFMYEREDVKRLIRLVESGRVVIGEQGGIETVGRYGLEEWEGAIERAGEATGWGKQVVLEPGRE
jgi:D-arabinose 1-dehydrogenase-like Zn-dependent alcohol dehydrogenase